MISQDFSVFDGNGDLFISFSSILELTEGKSDVQDFNHNGGSQKGLCYAKEGFEMSAAVDEDLDYGLIFTKLDIFIEAPLLNARFLTSY